MIRDVMVDAMCQPAFEFITSPHDPHVEETVVTTGGGVVRTTYQLSHIETEIRRWLDMRAAAYTWAMTRNGARP